MYITKVGVFESYQEHFTLSCKTQVETVRYLFILNECFLDFHDGVLVFDARYTYSEPIDRW